MPARGGRPAAQTAGGRPAARAAAAPPRSTLRREIRGDQRCSLMAGVLLTIGLAGRWRAPAGSWRPRPRQRSWAGPGLALRLGQGWWVVGGRVTGPRGLGGGRGGRRAGRAGARRRRR